MFYWRRNIVFIFLVFFFLVIQSYPTVYADNPAENVPLQKEISLSAENIQSIIFEVRNMISGLGQSVPVQQRGVIEHVIGLLPLEEQVSLKQALDDKLRDISSDIQLPKGTDDVSIYTGQVISEGVAHLLPEGIVTQIQSLNLGPSATVEDLRARDNIVAVIAGIQDPDLRYELLEFLSSKERS